MIISSARVKSDHEQLLVFAQYMAEKEHKHGYQDIGIHFQLNEI